VWQTVQLTTDSEDKRTGYEAMEKEKAELIKALEEEKKKHTAAKAEVSKLKDEVKFYRQLITVR
jgi:cell division protein FtsB